MPDCSLCAPEHVAENRLLLPKIDLLVIRMFREDCASAHVSLESPMWT